MQIETPLTHRTPTSLLRERRARVRERELARDAHWQEVALGARGTYAGTCIERAPAHVRAAVAVSQSTAARSWAPREHAAAAAGRSLKAMLGSGTYFPERLSTLRRKMLIKARTKHRYQ